MAEAAPVIDFDDARGVPIADVCSVLGVPMPTLRSWELRYAMPSIRHVHGRHRRYLPAEVHAIRLMRDEIARGQPAGLAAATVRRMLGIGGPAGVFIHRLLEESERLDTKGMRTTLDQTADDLGLPDCVDDVLLPTMRQVGIWWEIGHCDIAQERVATETVRAWLDRRTAFAPVPTTPRPIVLACGPKDWHTIGLECLAMLLRHQGIACRILGPRVPTPTVVTAANASDAAAVVIVSHLASGRRLAVESIQALHRVGLPVFYAGHSFATAKSRAGLPGLHLASRIQDACDDITTALADTDLPAVG
jgi:methylmalonyl-CoA mutase cobalamin-binding subunit/DNA-binding transcriptional MerR regulator